MDRHHPVYQERKTAWEGVQTTFWLDFLKPLLEQKAHTESRTLIGSLDEAFAVAQAHAEIEYARFLLAKVERTAEAFLNTQIQIQ